MDVNIYAAGEGVREKLRGNHENTEIGRFIKDYMELDLDAVTTVLNSEYPLEFWRLITGNYHGWRGGWGMIDCRFRESWGDDIIRLALELAMTWIMMIPRSTCGIANSLLTSDIYFRLDHVWQSLK